MEEDRYGLRREKKLLESGVRDVFTPHKPIDSQKLFRGRNQQVKQLIEQMNTPGQHALLYGERGVGKTSLANVVAEVLALIKGYQLIIKRCDSSETFESIVAGPLKEAGIEVDLLERTRRIRKAKSGKLGLSGSGAEVSKDDEVSEVVDARVELQPSFVAEALKDHAGLLVIDEADAIRKKKDRQKLAELLKLLSDSGSKLKVLVVGIAETGSVLTGEHPSVQRCLKETKLTRMTDQELREIIELGSKDLGLSFDDDVVARIVAVSGGYPHFTHLLALKCAEEAIAADRKTVRGDDLKAAVASAIQDAEGTLERKYRDAIRSYETDMYENVVRAAAAIFKVDKPEFTAAELRKGIKEVTGETILQASLNNYLGRLVSESDETILRRLAKGIYRFNDPRMPAYVRIANEEV